MAITNGPGDGDGWARPRFAVVGPLLAPPPPKGRPRAGPGRLSPPDREHPTRGGRVRFPVPAIERWYHRARSAGQDPVPAPRRRVRSDAGRARRVPPLLMAAPPDRYGARPSWSARLHHDNLRALAGADPPLGPMPSCATLARVMRAAGMERRRRRRRFGNEPGRPAAGEREALRHGVSRSHALWHADFHHAGTCRVLTASGAWRTPILLSFLDDHTRLGRHLQWYLGETAGIFVNGIGQAFMKGAFPGPRSRITDRR